MKAYDRDDGPGAAIAIMQDGGIIFSKGYGMVNIEHDIPITTSTIFNVASISKQFCAWQTLIALFQKN